MAKKRTIKLKREKRQKYPAEPKGSPLSPEDDWGILDMVEPDDALDLHGYDKLSAEIETEEFIREARRGGYRKIRIITGSGSHSPDHISILRPAVISIIDGLDLPRKNADAWQGGAGAIDVKLI